MTGRRGKPISKTRGIENALFRLGMQAGNREVVAALEAHGIDVSAGLVQAVKLKLLKETAAVRKQRTAVPRGAVYQCRGHPPKVPPRRGFRS
jgi:hypothetical protein